jgi:hypothetical protein
MTDAQLESEIQFAEVITTYYWGTRLESVQIDNRTFPITVDKAIFDSGASLNYLPELDFYNLIQSVTTDKYCWQAEQDNFICSCPNGKIDTHAFPTIEISLGSTILSFQGQWYTHYYYSYMGYRDVCLINFLNGGNSDYWLMGDPLLRAYLTIYDRDNMRIGFVGNTEENSNEIEFIMMIAIFASVGIGIIVLLICCCVLFCQIKKQFEKKNNVKQP